MPVYAFLHVRRHVWSVLVHMDACPCGGCVGSPKLQLQVEETARLGCWELNSRSVDEQQALLSMELSLQPL